MKVLMLNGSPKANGNTALALREVASVLEKEGIEVEIVQVGHLAVRGCVACLSCRKTGKCVVDDIVNELAEKLKEADGMVVASPVYYAAANSTLTAVLDRLFYSSSFDKRMKVGAAIAVARRGGTTATFDQLNKYFAISGMPIVPSQYWNIAHGTAPGDIAEDGEGLQTMRTLGANMAFLMKSISLGKEAYGLPEKEAPIRTGFVR